MLGRACAFCVARKLVLLVILVAPSRNGVIGLGGGLEITTYCTRMLPVRLFHVLKNVRRTVSSFLKERNRCPREKHSPRWLCSHDSMTRF